MGAGSALPFLAGTAVAGGALALGLAVVARSSWGRGRARPSLPYGVAIAAGGVLGTLGGF